MKLLLHPSSIRQARLTAGISQQKLASITEVHIAQISRAENGSGSHSSTLEKLTAALLRPVYHVLYELPGGEIEGVLCTSEDAYRRASAVYWDKKAHGLKVWITMDVEPLSQDALRAGGAE